MAWISVHEQVIGGKLRSLAQKIGCSQNEALGLLVRFWLWGIHNASPDGRLESATKEDVADVLNIGIDKRCQPEAVVEAMIAVGWIDFDNGCLYIHDWQEWQKQWYKAMRIRSFDNERKARKREEQKELESQEALPDNPLETESKKGDSSDSNAEETTNPPSGPAKKATNAYSTGFEEFWNVYPRKLGKGEAYKCYNARLKDGWSPAELLEAAQNYAEEVAKARTEPHFIKHPKTFLSANTPFADFIRSHSPGGQERIVEDEDPFRDWRQ